jgi:hypothetical protein
MGTIYHDVLEKLVSTQLEVEVIQNTTSPSFSSYVGAVLSL